MPAARPVDMRHTIERMAKWEIVVPIVAAALLAVGWCGRRRLMLLALCVPALCAAVIAAVHHAEVVAHRVGEPYGTLVLALAVTVIEVALILSDDAGQRAAEGRACRATRSSPR